MSGRNSAPELTFFVELGAERRRARLLHAGLRAALRSEPWLDRLAPALRPGGLPGMAGRRGRRGSSAAG